MSEKEKAIKALRQMIEQNEARGQKESKLRDWFNGLNRDLWKAIETLQQA
ncbi:peptidase [Desulforamulus ferrireducens]|uniref:Peptidase n=1 Tax=Desulforamulus ferrireducens TaxID=1833852 RepID=A0A1S6IVI8_9FIRM|nr:peptidase [Desulforamulus ferrireducens]AQS58754.1 peptidase [Desulforamulus ferrireducens]